MLKVGLVGVGAISGAHISGWADYNDAKLVAVCDIRPEQMEKVDGVNKYTSFDEMLSNEELDIVDICLPTFLHAEYAIKAMEKGKHVLCEKPISLNIDDVDRFYGVAERMNVKFMVAQVLRFWPEFEYIKELYENKKYGKLLSGHMYRLSSMPRSSWEGWMTDEKRSGLTPYDLHIHDLDFMVYAFGKPDFVETHRSKLANQDYFSATYGFGDAFISAEAAWYHGKYPFEAGFRFQFENAVAVFKDHKLTINTYDEIEEFKGMDNADDEGDGYAPTTSAYGNEIRYFAECVLNDRIPDKVKPKELKSVINILNSI